MTQLISDSGRVILKEVLADIRLNPETHKQRQWICGTAACLAGKVVLLHGATPAWGNGLAWSNGLEGPAANRSTSTVIDVDGSYQHVGTLASQILGISPATASVLYAGDNTIDQMEIMFGLLDAGIPIAAPCECRDDCRNNVPSPWLEEALEDAGLR